MNREIKKENKLQQERRAKYKELFPEQIKAELFDMIAEEYYFGNFGTMSKSEMEVLMFSIYIDRILEVSEEDISSYSNYNMSRWLGITQNRVNSFKEKKQLLYPREYDWKAAFLRICQNADIDNGYIHINISDRNLFLEIKNAIEEDGGYVEGTLTQNLIKVKPSSFIGLLYIIAEENDRAEIRKLVQDKMPKLKELSESPEYGLKDIKLWDMLKNIAEETALEVITTFNPVAGSAVKSAIEQIKLKTKYAHLIRDENGTW